jgi:hypothetical protein
LDADVSLAPLSSFFFVPSALVEGLVLVVSEFEDSVAEGEADASCPEALMLNAAVATTATAAEIK